MFRRIASRRGRWLLVLGAGGLITLAACTPVKPPAPEPPDAPTLALATVSDTGSSNSDRLTNDTTPTFEGDAEEGLTVHVFDLSGTDPVEVGSGAATASGFNITSIELTPGTHTFRAVTVDAANNVSDPSPELEVTIDTTAPAPPPILDLHSDDDSGVSNTDNVTNVDKPTFTGTKLADHRVQVFSGTTVLNGSTVWDATTSYSIDSTLDMLDGLHSVTAAQIDPAGNVSAPTPVLSVRIDTVAPAVGLDPVTDPNTDGTPELAGPAGVALGDFASVTVEIFQGTDASGTLAGTLTATPSAGTWAATPSSTLADDVYTARARQGDVAGNEGFSPIDTFTVNAP